MTRRAVIVGGNGFIGQEIMRQATGAGLQLLNLDPAPPRTAGAPSVAHLPVSITDQAQLRSAIDEFRPDFAINLAAYGEGTHGLASGAAQHPDRAVEINIGGTVNLLTALAAAGCTRLVWASSSTVYGPATTAEPVPETVVLQPDTVYGATKVGAEAVAGVLAAQHGMTSVAVRLPLIYGGGRWYGGSQDQLVRFVGDLIAGRPAHLDAWTATADWMHATDAAAVMLALAQSSEANAPAYNVRGHQGSLHQLGVALRMASGEPSNARVSVAENGSPGLPLMDTRRIEADQAFRPVVTTAEEGARRYLAEARALHRAEEIV